jgi:hypothetical protein
MKKPAELKAASQLVVEGNDALRFFQAFLKHCQRSTVQVQNFGGVNELTAFLKALALMPHFRSLVTKVAVIRDAEANAQSAWQSVASSLAALGWPVPAKPGGFASGPMTTGIFILPDNQNAGTLESLCLAAVQADPAMSCVSDYMQCITLAGLSLPTSKAQLDKARVQAFLASRNKPGLRLGEAAEKGYWPLNNSAFDALRCFCQKL